MVSRETLRGWMMEAEIRRSRREAALAAREGWAEAPRTQFGRGLQELAIGWIGARSPEAKGGVERHFQTAPDRL